MNKEQKKFRKVLKARKVRKNWQRRHERLKVLVKQKEKAVRAGLPSKQIDREASQLVEYKSKKFNEKTAR